MVLERNKLWIGLIAACLQMSCRTSREKVEVLGSESRPRTSTDPSDASSIPASQRSSLLIYQVSLPPGVNIYRKINVAVFPVENDIDGDGKQFENYKIGTPIPLVGLKEYRVDVKALGDGDIILAENRHCNEQLRFKAVLGQNRYTAPLCLGPSAN